VSAKLPPLNEFGLLPVPPAIHKLPLKALPGCFGVKPFRRELWNNCLAFLKYLTDYTPIREVYLDGRFFTASDDVNLVEVGIELDQKSLNVTANHSFGDALATLKIPARDEFGVRVRYFAPIRPNIYNFHAEFSSPDPDIGLKDAPAGLRKGYIKVTL
jgi:hypothetical protein